MGKIAYRKPAIGDVVTQSIKSQRHLAPGERIRSSGTIKWIGTYGSEENVALVSWGNGLVTPCSVEDLAIE